MSRFCDHCGLPLPPGTPLSAVIAGEEKFFCCSGCRGACLLLHESGLGAFYERREWQTPGVPEGAFAQEYGAGYLENFVTSDGERAEILFLVEGIRCASCVWVIEKLLARLDGVLEARLNYGTHRAKVRFDPDRVDAARIFAAVSRIGYRPRPFSADRHARLAEGEKRTLLIRFGTAFFLSMQLMGFSFALYAGYFSGIDPTTKAILHGFAAVVATPVVFYAGSPFLHGAWRSVRNRRPDMDLLVSLGILASYGVSLHALAAGGEVYFDTAAMIVTLLLAGRLFESGARRRAAAGVDRLLRLAPETAIRLVDGGSEEVASARLQVGDLLRVRPGERFPVDGQVVAGEGEVDEAAVTGEARPVWRGAGEAVSAGTVNLGTVFTVRVTALAADSFIARVAQLVEEAQMRRAPIQGLADRVAGWFVPAVACIAAATWLYWRLFPNPEISPLLTAVAVLVVACPCALGLATPTAILVATGAAARRGILFRGGDVLEAAGRLTLAAFDKTGTLTEGRPQLVEVRPADDVEGDELLRLAAAAESGSLHPLGRAVVTGAHARGLAVGEAGHGECQPGFGIRCGTGGTALWVGSRSFLARAGVEMPEPCRGNTETEVHVARGSRYLGLLLFADRPRRQAAASLETLRRLGLRTALLTGDHQAAAARLAGEVPLQEVHAALDPAAKREWVAERRRRGERVLMVGDGINDAPALAEADVGCALAGSTDIALETSDLVLTRPDLGRLVEAVELARRTFTVIRQNLFWAFFYNLLAIPLAAAGQLAPIHAAAAMAFSSVCVVGNSLRLARWGSPKSRVPGLESENPDLDGEGPERKVIGIPFTNAQR